MRILSERAIRDIAYGSTVLAAGGGGDPYIGTMAAIESVRQGGSVELISAAELPDDALVAFPFLVGAPVPFLEKLTLGPELERVQSGLERFLGRKVDAVMSAEVGGANSTLPMLLASRGRIPMVDGDLIGRAFPEIQLCVMTLYGLSASPVVVGDEHGNTVAISATSNHWGERLARAAAICFGAICVAIAYPISGYTAKTLTLRGTITWAERIGAAVREAREKKCDGVEAVLGTTGAVLLFRGKIIDVDRRVEHGWALGSTTLAGTDSDEGHTMRLEFQNEHLVAARDGEIVASVPDIITVLDTATGKALTTEALRYGFRVAVIGLACHPVWRTSEGLELAGPRRWGYEHAYTPLPGAFPPAEQYPWVAPADYSRLRQMRTEVAHA